MDGHKTKAIPIFNVVVFIHFPSKKACPKSSAAPFRQNRPLSFRNHRSEAPADSGYILLKNLTGFSKNCGRCSLVRMNRINGNNRRHIFYRAGLQMPFNQIVSACVIHIRHIVKQNDIQVRFPRIQPPEILGNRTSKQILTPTEMPAISKMPSPLPWAKCSLSHPHKARLS